MKKSSITLSLLACLVHAAPVNADEQTEKLLYLLVEGDRLIASNIFFSRFDELKLTAEEEIVESAVAEAVAVVATNKRIIAYGALAGSWKTMRYLAGEKLVRVEAADSSALILTSARILNFNGKNGLWAQTRR